MQIFTRAGASGLRGARLPRDGDLLPGEKREAGVAFLPRRRRKVTGSQRRTVPQTFPVPSSPRAEVPAARLLRSGRFKPAAPGRLKAGGGIYLSFSWFGGGVFLGGFFNVPNLQFLFCSIKYICTKFVLGSIPPGRVQGRAQPRAGARFSPQVAAAERPGPAAPQGDSPPAPSGGSPE